MITIILITFVIAILVMNLVIATIKIIYTILPVDFLVNIFLFKIIHLVENAHIVNRLYFTDRYLASSRIEVHRWPKEF